MATTQYIGARYVPLFAEPAQWDSSKQYEPLTIVMNNGNSYTSRQYVPAGIDLTNDAYWALTGNYNAQVEQYRQEVTTYDQRITKAQSTADNAKSDAANASAVAKSASDAVLTETKRATEKEEEIESLVQTNETDIAHLDAQMAATTGSELLTRIANESSARTAADSALGTRIDTEKSEREAANAALNETLTKAINDRFPVGTDSILDGAITSTKLAQSAINAILNGAEIKCFDSENSNADNAGLVCPSGFKISGCYIDALKLLIINSLSSENVRWVDYITSAARNGITLPSYVPNTNMARISSCGLLLWTSSAYFSSWTGFGIGTNRYIGPNSEISSNQNSAAFGSNVICLAPYITGTTVTNAHYGDYANQNAVI